MKDKKTTKFFSKPLLKQDIKGNSVLLIAITLVMCLVCVVSTYATSMISTRNNSDEISEAQEDFYTYLYVMESFNEQSGTELSYEDYVSADDKTMYETAFEMANQQSDSELSLENFDEAAAVLEDTDVDMDTYVREFEYVYALSGAQGCFTDESLSIDDMMSTIMESIGVDPSLMETLKTMDTTAMFNRVFYTMMSLLPIFIYVIVVGNSLIVNQVDKGSMAYVLSTPTKRSAITFTQMLFMVVSPAVILAVTCCTKIAASSIFLDEYNVQSIIALYAGMYVLVEAVSGICYLGSCIFNQSSRAMAFGGGLTVWFFLATLLGMFGSADMVSMGFGVEELDIFNKLTLVGLYDVDALSTVGTAAVDTVFVWKLVLLAAIAVLCYGTGSLIFKKKDLPL